MASQAAARRTSLGRQGEDLAAAYLAAQGYTVIARNWRTRSGEIDIVAREGDWLVFVEVRTRRLRRRDAVPPLGAPEDSITPRKQMRLAAMAEAYLFEMPFEGPVRIDVIALEIASDGSVLRLNHLRDAVGGVA